MADDDLELAFSALSMNADWTNRKASVNTSAKLISRIKHIVEQAQNEHPRLLVTVQEVGPGNGKKIIEECSKLGFDGVCEKVAYDHLVVMWDTSCWDYVEHVHSTAGKFVSVVLDDAERAYDRTVFTGVHLPFKVGRNIAIQANQVALETFEEEYEATRLAFAGDYNATPSRLDECFDGHELALDDLQMTTARGCLDNFLRPALDEGFGASLVMNNVNHFKHKPIVTEFIVEE